MKAQFDQMDEFHHQGLSAERCAEEIGEVDETLVAVAKTCKKGEFTLDKYKQALEGVSVVG